MEERRFVEPVAPEFVKALPQSDDWIYEIKFDGYRTLIVKEGQRVAIRSRKGKDLTAIYPAIPSAALQVKA